MTFEWSYLSFDTGDRGLFLRRGNDQLIIISKLVTVHNVCKQQQHEALESMSGKFQIPDEDHVLTLTGGNEC